MKRKALTAQPTLAKFSPSLAIVSRALANSADFSRFFMPELLDIIKVETCTGNIRDPNRGTSQPSPKMAEIGAVLKVSVWDIKGLGSGTSPHLVPDMSRNILPNKFVFS